MSLIKVTIVIPVYQNEESLLILHDSIVTSLNINNISDYEVIYIDDGSTDLSFEILKTIQSTNEFVRIIKLSRNFGQFAAINAGLNHAKGGFISCISADLQDPPELIPSMIELLEKGNDLVFACRSERKDNIFTKLTSKIHYSLIRMSNPQYPKNGFDFWAINRKALNAYLMYSDVIRSTQIDFLSMGFKIQTINYNRKSRPYGKSQYTFLKRLNVSLNQLLSTSIWPLRLSSFLGIFLTIVGIIYALRLFYGYFLDNAPFKGWTPIMMLLLIIGGFIMFMLGVIGEYLWRIYYETKKRPLYFIDEILD